MTTWFNPFFVNLLMEGAVTWSSATMGVALLHQTAVPSDTTPTSLAGLIAASGYQEVQVAGYARQTQALNSSVTGTVTKVVYGANFALNNTSPVFVEAAVWYLVGTYDTVVNPWIMISNDMFGNVVTPGAVLGSNETPKVLLSYAPSGSQIAVSRGTIVQSPGIPTWETSRVQHIWLKPQRVNWIPNPSFEAVSMFGWRSDGTLTRVVGGVDGAANHHGHTTGTIVESIPIPAVSRFRFSGFVRGGTVGTVHLDLVLLDSSYEEVGILSTDPLPLYTDWIRHDEIMPVPDDVTAVVPRIESSVPFDFDLMLLERGYALHDYFDGDSQTGMPGDFSWQGGQAQSYSFWYNNRFVTAARLFGGYQDGQVVLPSLVNDWIPQDSAIATHWDVLSEQDTKHPLKDWSNRVFVP